MKSKLIRVKVWYEANPTTSAEHVTTGLERELAAALKRGRAHGQTTPAHIYQVDIGETAMHEPIKVEMDTPQRPAPDF